MNINKLFNVLVLGGSMLASTSHANEVFTSLVLCSSSNQCTESLSCSEDGEAIKKLVPKDGLTCCWGTSCADLDNLNNNE